MIKRFGTLDNSMRELDGRTPVVELLKDLCMTNFWITLDEEQFESEGDMVALGSLKIGEFQEGFHASLSYWKHERYQAQWREALERLIDGEERSALVTSMVDPRTANFIRWWPLYLIGDSVHFQEQILFVDQLEQPFEEANPYKSVFPRQTASEDEERVSEWTVNLSDIEVFLAAHHGWVR